MNTLEDENSEKVLIKTVGYTVSKISLFICILVTFGLSLNMCKVNEEVIIQCKESCGERRGMKEVTSTKCECGTSAQNSNNDWIIPRLN